MAIATLVEANSQFCQSLFFAALIPSLDALPTSFGDALTFGCSAGAGVISVCSEGADVISVVCAVSASASSEEDVERKARHRKREINFFIATPNRGWNISSNNHPITILGFGQSFDASEVDSGGALLVKALVCFRSHSRCIFSKEENMHREN
jgi:hypothetical protein